jgi:O-antigen/teichoic acid export membrane protein
MNRLWSQTFWLTASRFGWQVLIALSTLLLARRLGSAGFGGYAFIAAVMLIGNAVTTFGTDMHLIRGIAATRDLSALPAALLIQLGLSTLFIAAVMVVASRLPHQGPDTIRGLEIYSLALLPLAFSSVCATALRGMGEMGAYATLNFLYALVQAALIWLLLSPGGSVSQAATLLLLTQLIGAALAMGLCALRLPGFLREGHRLPAEIRALFIASAPVALLASLAILYQRLSLLMLPALGGALLTGWFAAAARTVEAAKLFHVAAFTALYPQMSRLAAAENPVIREGAGEPTRHGQKPLWGLLGVAAAISLGLSLLAGPIMRLLFGADYGPAVPALGVLAWALVPYTVTTYLSLSLLAAGRERIILRGLIAGLGTLAALNLLLVPLGGVRAAGWACLIAELAQAGVLLAHGIPVHRTSATVQESQP